MKEEDVLKMDDNWDEQIRMTKVTTCMYVLDYRFPKMPLGFLYKCSVKELDEIIDHISTITEIELEKYHHENGS